MRICERLKRVKWRERWNTKREQGKARGSKQAFIFWAPTCPPHLPISLSISQLFCLSDYCVYFISTPCWSETHQLFFFLSENIFLSHFQTHAPRVSPIFAPHFLPCLSITITVTSICARYTRTVCTVSTSLICPSFGFSFASQQAVDHRPMNSTFKCSLQRAEEQSHNSTKSPVLQHTCPRILQTARNKSRYRLMHTNMFPQIQPYSAIKGFYSKALNLHIKTSISMDYFLNKQLPDIDYNWLFSIN